MSKSLIQYRVFIASPSGLEAERSAFKDAISDYNDSEALYRGVYFRPVGWEETLPGLGRPQSLINEDIKCCDYFVLLLCDRWGSPSKSGSDKTYSSGTYEEYCLAIECVRRSDRDMKDIATFFKSVDPRQIADPGEQLKQVLAFKKEIQEEHELLYLSFDDVVTFKAHLTRLLASWMRQHESVKSKDPESPLTSLGAQVERIESVPEHTIGSKEIEKDINQPDQYSLSAELAPRNRQNFFLAEARQLREQGQANQAERIYERIVDVDSISTDREKIFAMKSLSDICLERGDFPSAKELLQKAAKLASQSDGYYGEFLIRADEGDIDLQLGRSERAIAAYLESVRGAEISENTPARAYINHRLGRAQFFEHRFDLSLTSWNEALLLRKAQKDSRPTTTINALLMVLLARMAMGEDVEPKSHEIQSQLGAGFEDEVGSPILEYRTLAWFGWKRGALDVAERSFRHALSQAEQVTSESGQQVVVQLEDLTLFLLQNGSYREAEHSANRAIVIIRKRFGKAHPLVALQSFLLGLVYVAQGGFLEAQKIAENFLSGLAELQLDGSPRAASGHYLLGLARWGSGEPELGNESFLEGIRVIDRTGTPNLPLLSELVRVNKFTARGLEFKSPYSRRGSKARILMGPLSTYKIGVTG